MRRIVQPNGLRIAQVLPRQSATAVQPLHSRRSSSNHATEDTAKEAAQNPAKVEASKGAESSVAIRKKTVAELDEELRLKLEGISGEGGVAGLELENGKAVAMKRGVRENMFRLI